MAIAESVDAPELKVDAELSSEIKDAVGDTVKSHMAEMLVAAAGAAVLALVAINYKSSSMKGDTEMKPSDDDVSINKAEVSGHESEGKAAQDSVAGQNGEVKASETQGRASTTEATASEAGVSASRAKAGASDIETKALKMT